MPNEQRTPMTESERQLMLRVLDGNPELATFVYHLWHYRKAENMLRYLIANDLVGAKLWLFVKQECGGTPMNLAKELLKRINNAKEISSVLIGRDFLS